MPTSEWYAGYCDALDGESCDVSSYLDNEVPDYRQGYVDGADQVNEANGTPTPIVVQQRYVFECQPTL